MTRAMMLLAVCPSLTGCVERRMTIRTNLDNQGGASVIVDGQEIGVTPVSTGFTYYGDRKIRLIKDGYETVTLIQPMRAPWWDSLPLEFFVENLWPRTIRDEREFRYVLPPQVNVTTDEVLQRAHNLRIEGQTRAETVLPTGGIPSNKVNF
ncbi:MAG: PEGA domain-containing protein [Planctomycetes bacterium]|nr:PEGA domain-containing protein [Planctomycetota bacterium]